jgi:phosphoserine phosphatase
MALNVPAPIRLICFDLDGTLIDGTIFIWSTLHEAFGSDPVRRKKAAQEHRAGHISYTQWFETDLLLLSERGATKDKIRKVISGLRPAMGAVETLRVLKERGYKLGIISGSLDLVLEHFFGDISFDHVLLNRIAFSPDGRIQGGEATRYDLEGKAAGLTELARREGLDLSQCAFVGDNTNDLAVMRAAGFSVGVFIKHEDVRSAAHVVIQEEDLRAILPFFPPREALKVPRV